MKKLDVAAAIRAGGPKRHTAGNSLSLVVRGGSALWEWQYKEGRKTRTICLGSAKGPQALSLTAAREARTQAWFERRGGKIHFARRGGGKTFGETVTEYLAEKAPNWRGGLDGLEAKDYRARLTGTDFAALPVATLTTDDVRRALEKWKDRPRTWVKLQGRIERVLDWATASEFRSGDNPARLVGVMEHFRPPAKAVKHHAALPAEDVSDLMGELDDLGSRTCQALKFTVLTAVRSGETLGGVWAEIEGDTWIISADRMKVEGREHRVPLTPEALALLGERQAPDVPLFANKQGKPLHDHAMQERLKTLRTGCTVHGFRSTFKDWAMEAGYPSELSEMALAHTVGDATERAYRRTDMIEKRREMMAAWAKFATTPPK